MEYIMEKVLTEVDIINYLDIRLIIILLCIGYLIKHNFSKFNNKYIHHILLLIAIIYNIINSGFNINSIFNSIISATIAIGIHSSGKNILKSAVKKNKDIISDIEESIEDEQ